MNADVHALVGAYAMDALPPEEAAAFVEHLDQCPACQQEVAELQITAAQLGLAVTQTPPAALRDQVLTAVSQTRQIPPATSPAPTRDRRANLPRLLATAAALLVIVGAGLFALMSNLDNPTGPAAPDPVAAVLNAPDARTNTVGLRGGGTMTVISSDRRDQAVVLSQNLPPITTDRVYQLWLVDEAGNARSADVLIDSSTAATRSARLIRGLRAGDQIAITREPPGGSQQPTMAPLAITQSV
jgi:anti-sigma factor RsiW